MTSPIPLHRLSPSHYYVLGQALGDCSKVITIRHPSSTPRAITQAHLSIPNTIFIGILHDHSHTFLVVDKTELRRFKGRRIIQSVVWDVHGTSKRPKRRRMYLR